MENNENFVTEEVTEEVIEEVAENVEQTTEQTQPAEKTYTQAEVDAIVGKRLARQEARIRKDNDRKYGGLVEVLKTGTGKEDVGEITDTFRQFYEKKGVKFREQPSYTDQDIEVLAKADAKSVIDAGYDEVVDEVNRLTQIGAENMTPRERAVFIALAEHRQAAERSRELSQIGVTEDVYNSQEFKDFAGKFNHDTPITDIYDIYRKTKPKKEIRTMGSMKQTQDEGVKDYYSPEEIERLTEEDLDDPRVWEAVRRSMTGQ